MNHLMMVISLLKIHMILLIMVEIFKLLMVIETLISLILDLKFPVILSQNQPDHLWNS